MENETVEYRNFSDGERNRVHELLKDAALPTEGVEEMGSDLVVASLGDQVVGAAGLEVHGHAGLLRSVVVDEAFRGRGIGSALVRRIISQAVGIRLEMLYLLTEDAAAYFETLGFERVDRAEVSEDVRRSDEFSRICPASAVAMQMRLNEGGTFDEGEGRRGTDPKR